MFEKQEVPQSYEIQAEQALAKLLQAEQALQAMQVALSKTRGVLEAIGTERDVLSAQNSSMPRALQRQQKEYVDLKFDQETQLDELQSNIDQAKRALKKILTAWRHEQNKSKNLVWFKDAAIEQSIQKKEDKFSALSADIAVLDEAIANETQALSDTLSKEHVLHETGEEDVYQAIKNVLPRIKQDEQVNSLSTVCEQSKTIQRTLSTELMRLSNLGLLAQFVQWFWGLLGYEKPEIKVRKAYVFADTVHSKLEAIRINVNERSSKKQKQVELTQEVQKLKTESKIVFKEKAKEADGLVVSFLKDRKPRVVTEVRAAVHPNVVGMVDRVFKEEKVDEVIETSARMRTMFFNGIQHASNLMQDVLAHELRDGRDLGGVWHTVESPPPEPEVLTRPDSVLHVAESLHEFLQYPTRVTLYKLEHVMKQYPEFYDEEPEFRRVFQAAVALYPDELGAIFAALQAQVKQAQGRSPQGVSSRMSN